MKIYEIRTELPAAEVIERARSFFTLASTPYASFEEVVGEGYLKLFLEVGEIVIGAFAQDGATIVRGSASRGAHLLTRFLATLSSPNNARQTVHRHGSHETRAALVEEFAGRDAARAVLPTAAVEAA